MSHRFRGFGFTSNNYSSRANVVVVMFLFAAIGGYIITRSFAATDISQLNGLLGTDTNYFPISVWLQTPTNTTTINGQTMTVAQAYANAGINLMNNGDYTVNNAYMQAVQNAGQGVIEANQASGLASSYKSLIKAWGQQDEPDNAQSNSSGGYDPCINPATIVANYNNLKTGDSTRPVIINYGQGAAYTTWGGRGTCTGLTDMYKTSWNGGAGYPAGPAYSAGADILSFDVYPVNDGYPLTYVSDGVDNLRNWTGDTKPVWAFLEVTNFDSGGSAPTPAQVKAETWLALTHGARGLQYFSHIFTPTFVEAGLLTDQNMYNAVKANNLQIKNLAPQLNSPTINNGATVVSSLRIDKIVKKTGNDTYVFAVTPGTNAGNATFSVAGASNGTVSVIDENRTLPMTNGSFTDSFAAYGVHLYKISTAATGPTANLWVDINGGSCTTSSSEVDYASGDAASCPTIKAAYAAAAPGQTVRLVAGTISSGVTNNSDAITTTAKNPAVKFIGAGRASTTTGDIIFAKAIPSTAGAAAGGASFESLSAGKIETRQGTIDVTWKDMHVDQFYIRGSTNVMLDNVEAGPNSDITNFITACNSSCADGYNPAVGSKTITIKNSYIHDFTRPSGSGAHVDCIAIDDVDGLIVQNTQFKTCQAYGIIFGVDLYGAGRAKNVVIQNNVFNQHAVGSAGITPDGYDDLAFTGTIGPTVVRFNSFLDDHAIKITDTRVDPSSITIDSNAWNTINTAECTESAFVFSKNVGGNSGCANGVTASPKFVSATDPHLQAGSPAQNVGNAAATPYSGFFATLNLTRLTSDYYGSARDSQPDAGAVEMSGGSTPKQGDLNGDNVVNIFDLSILLSHYGQTGQSTSNGDLNNDAVVNIFDLSILLSKYGT